MKKERKSRRRVRFEVDAEPGCSVYVAGTFNAWNPRRKKLAESDRPGNYAATMLLPRGRHEYKFVINGTWCVDPQCREWTPNDQGSLNSVLVVD